MTCRKLQTHDLWHEVFLKIAWYYMPRHEITLAQQLDGTVAQRNIAMRQTRQWRRLQAIKHGWEHLKDCFKPVVRKFVSPTFVGVILQILWSRSPAVAYSVTKIAPASAQGRKNPITASAPVQACHHRYQIWKLWYSAKYKRFIWNQYFPRPWMWQIQDTDTFICKKLTLQD